MATFFNATVLTRYYSSTYHLWAARHFARLTSERESEPDPNFDIQHRAYATNAILSAVAFMEAAINELFDDLIDGHPGFVASLPEETKRDLTERYTTHERAERWPTLKKYQRALRWAAAPTFDKKDQPYADAQLLVELRNRLTHAHTKTQETGDMDDLSKALSQRFKSHRHMGKMANPYFPDQCLGAECASWAVASAQAMADEFFRRMGLQPNYQERFSDVLP